MTGEIETDDLIGKVGHSLSNQRGSKGKGVPRDVHDNIKKGSDKLKIYFMEYRLTDSYLRIYGHHGTNSKNDLFFPCCRCEDHKYRIHFRIFAPEIILGMFGIIF